MVTLTLLEKEMKITTFNTNIGSYDADVEEYPEYQTRTDDIADFLKNLDSDIITLNELIGMSNKNKYFDIFLERSGYKYGKLFETNNKKRCYCPLAVLSKEPFEEVTHPESREFWHQLCHIRYPKADLSIFFTHMEPFTHQWKEKESIILSIIAARDKSSKKIITGDMNALSHLDVYKLDEIAKEDAERKKFITDSGSINYNVSKTIESAGFVDSFHIRKPYYDFGETVPTLFGQKPGSDTAHHGVKKRLDYIYVNKILAPYVESCKTTKTAEYLSDHLPVTVKFSDNTL
jgi:exonuclease III